jgi:phosphoribosylanthranilate isomerase
MNTTKVKICGLTNAADARLATTMGADYLGVIFADSARRVTVAQAQEIRSALPTAVLVGVFMNQPLDEVVATSSVCGVDMVQLHGNESPAYCNDVRLRTGKPIVKAFQAVRVPDAARLASYGTTSYFLFDYDRKLAPSSSALEDAWGAVAIVRRIGFRLFVAGGIDPSNVRDIIARTNAFAVDVCRGVESQPGTKDPSALEHFMAEARA